MRIRIRIFFRFGDIFVVEAGPFKIVNIADYETLRETLAQEVFNSRGNYNDLLNGKPPMRGGTQLAYYPGIVDAEGLCYVWITCTS